MTLSSIRPARGAAIVAFGAACCACWPVPSAAAGESEFLVLGRVAFCSGGMGAHQGFEMHSAVGQAVGAEPAPASQNLTLHPGYLAPWTDRAGLITHSRIEDILLGRSVPPEPVAIDFSGNRDGRIDVADLLTLNRRQIP